MRQEQTQTGAKLGRKLLNKLAKPIFRKYKEDGGKFSKEERSEWAKRVCLLILVLLSR